MLLTSPGPAFPADYIISVRHGRFAGNVRAGTRGAAVDPISTAATHTEPLDTYGKEQIERVRTFLVRSGLMAGIRNFRYSPYPNDPAAPYSYRHSPYARTTDTAYILEPNGRWIADSRLRERERGEFFISHRELEATNPVEAQRKADHPMTYRFKGGETILESALRIVPIFRQAHQPTCLVRHGENMWGDRFLYLGLSEEFVANALKEERREGSRSPWEIRPGTVDIWASVHPRSGKKVDHIRWFRTISPAYPGDERDSNWIEIDTPFPLMTPPPKFENGLVG